MSTLTFDEVTHLSEVSSPACVSIYLPTHPASDERQQDPVRFKNLLRQAGERLAELGLTNSEVDQILAPGFSRLEYVFPLGSEGRGLAWFGSNGHHQTLELSNAVEAEVHVGRHYHTKPLLLTLQNQRPFYLLIVSKHGARLLDCLPGEHVELKLEDVPAGLPGIRRLEEHEEYIHARASSPGGDRAMHHGHGDRQEEQRDLEQFVVALARAVDRACEPGRPLVLAGPEEIVAMVRQVDRSRTILVDETLSGNQDQADEAALRERAWKLAEPLYRLEREAALERFQQARGQGFPCSQDLEEIVAAAFVGRVETLLLPARLEMPGTFDPKSLEIRPGKSPQSEDLLDLAARQTLLKGGRVHLFEPGTLDGPRAILRW